MGSTCPLSDPFGPWDNSFFLIDKIKVNAICHRNLLLCIYVFSLPTNKIFQNQNQICWSSNLQPKAHGLLRHEEGWNILPEVLPQWEFDRSNLSPTPPVPCSASAACLEWRQPWWNILAAGRSKGILIRKSGWELFLFKTLVQSLEN